MAYSFSIFIMNSIDSNNFQLILVSDLSYPKLDKIAKSVRLMGGHSEVRLSPVSVPLNWIKVFDNWLGRH